MHHDIDSNVTRNDIRTYLEAEFARFSFFDFPKFRNLAVR